MKTSAFLLALLSLVPFALAQESRTPHVVRTYIEDSEHALNKIAPAADLLKPEKRAEIAKPYADELKKQNTLIDELLRLDPNAGTGYTARALRNLAGLSLLGDAESTKRIDTLSKASGPRATYGKLTGLLRDYYDKHTDAAAQLKVIESVRTAAKALPADEIVSHLIFDMYHRGAAIPENREAVESILLKDLTSESAKRFQDQPRVGHPFAFAGELLTGQQFRSDIWKGKVILLHTWSTADAGTRSQIAKLKQINKDHAAKGLELIGLSTDNNQKDFAAYLKDNKDISWPQLYFRRDPPGHPLLAKWRIQAFPCTYVIDRNGICRGVDVSMDDLEKLLTPLLDEKPPAKDPKKP